MSVKVDENLSVEFFYQQNKKTSDYVEYKASDSFVDGEGNVISWKLRPITADEEVKIRERATERKIDKRTGTMNEIFHDQDYTIALVCQSVVYPDLTNSGLQNSYGVSGQANLIRKMLNAGELQSLALKVIEVTGLDDIEGQKDDNDLKTDLIKNS